MNLKFNKVYRLAAIVVVLSFFSLSNVFGSNQPHKTEEFSVSTLDGLTTVNGQIDFPNDENTKYPLVVMVPGTGLFDRNVEFGLSGSERDFVFKQIRNQLVSSGFAVLRYDYRGVACSWRTAPTCEDCTTMQERKEYFLKHCINNETRGGVTPENIRDDIVKVYSYGENHPKVDKNKVIAFGHSEGSVHLSYLVKSKRINPKGLIFVGGLADSPAATIKWQMTGRVVRELFSFDKNSDDILTNQEIMDGHKKSFLYSMPIEELTSETGFWTKEALKGKTEEEYRRVKNQALDAPDTALFESGGVVQASMRWWKMFFLDEQSVIDNLISYSGYVSYHIGDIDSQVSFSRQKLYINSIKSKLSCDVRLFKHHSKGHTLGDHATFGPISQGSMLKLVNDFINVLERP